MITAREKPVRVRLKTEWMGNQPGTIVTVNKRMADTLFRRDAGTIVKPETEKQIKSKLQRPAEDKMIKDSINK